MKILVIGNGFDLAHGLKTTYSDFLEYAGLISSDRQGDYYNDFRWLDEGWTIFFHDRQKALSNRWEGFESEIKRIVKVLYKAHSGETTNSIDAKISSLSTYFEGVSINESSSRVETLREKMEISLVAVIRMLEIYLAKEINTTLISQKNKTISDYRSDKVLSFNYTDTYERIYGIRDEEDICYIHGQATLEHDVSEHELSTFQDQGYRTAEEYKAWLNAAKCNMVLGIEEFQDVESQQNENYCMKFKKFYQRIFKKTGSTYKDWLRERDPIKDPELKIAFFGHSLDIMDREVIEELVNQKDADVTVYYHDNESLDRYIQNMVAIIGEANVITRVHGKNASLHFVEQDSAMI